MSPFEQISERSVKGRRLLTGDGVARARDDQEAGGRHGPLEEDAGIEAPVVLVADDDQQRHRELLQGRFHLPQHRPLGLQFTHGERMADRRMLGEHLGEFCEAARVLVLVSLARRAIGVARGGGRKVDRLEHLRRLARCGAALLDELGIGAGAVAATRRGHRQAALRIMNADMQGGRRAHGMADDVRLVDLQRIHQRDHVIAGDVLAVFGAVGRHVGRRIAALAIGDTAVRARKEPHLRLPGAIVACVFVHEDDWSALPSLFIIEASAIPCGDMRHLDPLLARPIIVCTQMNWSKVCDVSRQSSTRRACTNLRGRRE